MSAFLTETVAALLRTKGNQVFSIQAEATVIDAIRNMAENRVGALVVFNGTTLAGIVSERDYARKVILMGRNSQDTTVSEIMSSPVHSIGPEQTVDECLHLMTHERIRHLPVVKHGEIVGLVSMGDLVNFIISSQHSTINHLQNYITGEYPC